jgi:hypothetical protein
MRGVDRKEGSKNDTFEEKVGRWVGRYVGRNRAIKTADRTRTGARTY